MHTNRVVHAFALEHPLILLIKLNSGLLGGILLPVLEQRYDFWGLE